MNALVNAGITREQYAFRACRKLVFKRFSSTLNHYDEISRHTLQTRSDEEALIIVYQMLGAINYFLVSLSTLNAIFGETMYEEVNQRFTQNLALLIEASVNLSSSQCAG